MKQPHDMLLRALQGNWDFTSLEVEGRAMPALAFARSAMQIDGARFCMCSPEANYEGVFTIDASVTPARIDIHFLEGPEAGNWSYGIFELAGDCWTLCLGLTGAVRPGSFATSAGSGHALETLRRAARTRALRSPVAVPPGFEFDDTALYARLAGDWIASELVRDGQALAPQVLATGRRLGVRNEVKVHFGSHLMVDALFRIDGQEVDYFNANGTLQHGLVRWLGQEVQFCMAGAGDGRPDGFASGPGSGRTLSRWRRK
ncbi:MAG: TIGR03067 domain-containing protein [Pseudomonadota bacterium]